MEKLRKQIEGEEDTTAKMSADVGQGSNVSSSVNMPTASPRPFSPIQLIRESIYKIDEALKSIIGFVIKGKNWVTLNDIIPRKWKKNKVQIRSAMATTFAASLELVKSGDYILEQNSAFESLKIKSNDSEDRT